MPPISECVLEEGRPKYQVIRFQLMPPASSEKTITRPCAPFGGELMMPLVTALATPPPSCRPSQAPNRFITAAMSRATRGVSARVETEVAIALAESWKPFV